MPDAPAAAPLSLDRLKAAFAQMLGQPAAAGAADAPTAPIDPCEVGPRSIVEAALFVGRPDGAAIPAVQLAGVMRDVSEADIDRAVDALNDSYAGRDAPYHIERSAAGYRMTLRDQWRRTSERFYGRVAEARLSPAALEVLAAIAYRQPIAQRQIDTLRESASGPLVRQLVRRGLVAADRDASPVAYRTTPRFLALFKLSDVSQLPRTAELDD
ncbi:hypothetical protein Pla175_03600 [Pirellulimonas nuda]|uniref:Segregation and condensation protein B n=1 Tax=Pirellulimonas nuda TaxID=2528009 RepID=A0A518D6A9_9BACT|nr:SMC-Scp complex subunit ScpB [Pirellulimonas nuda]QDU87006.1 hypothetical protein Pla175_03600 [Pirellulimonas nuda]